MNPTKKIIPITSLLKATIKVIYLFQCIWQFIAYSTIGLTGRSGSYETVEARRYRSIDFLKVLHKLAKLI